MTAMRMPAFFLCHGGGPWPWLRGPLREMLHGLEQGLLAVPSQLPARPSAILVASAHWEASAFTVTSAQAPGMVYDYSGFPAEMYNIPLSQSRLTTACRPGGGLAVGGGLPGCA